MGLSESITTTTQAPTTVIQPVNVEDLQKRYDDLAEGRASADFYSKQVNTWLTVAVLLIGLFKKK